MSISKSVEHFFSTTIWQNPPGGPRRLIIRTLRILYLTVRGFQDHHGPLRASALTFYTLLSLVPVVAMAFGVAKGFGFERLLEKELLSHFAAQQEVITQVITFARNMLDNTKGGLIAGVGVLVLFWTVTKVLSNIEESFNHIWGATPRSWLRKLTDYLTITILAPLLLITAGSATVFVASQVSALSSQIGLENVVDPAVSLGLSLAPYMLLWFLFTLVYMIMPNTKVLISSALPAAILAGTAYQTMQTAYVKFQITMTSYNAIYGSFAALPLFLLWLNLSWHIVLFGAEITHALQHRDQRDPTEGGQRLSIRQVRLAALALCAHVAQGFINGQPAPTVSMCARSLNLAPALVEHVAALLIESRILSRVQNFEHEPSCLQPARDVTTLTVSQVMLALDNCGHNALFSATQPEFHGPAMALHNLEQMLDAAAASIRITEIADNSGSAPPHSAA